MTKCPLVWRIAKWEKMKHWNHNSLGHNMWKISARSPRGRTVCVFAFNCEIICVYALIFEWDSVQLKVYLYVQTHHVLELHKKCPSVFSLEDWVSLTLKDYKRQDDDHHHLFLFNTCLWKLHSSKSSLCELEIFSHPPPTLSWWKWCIQMQKWWGSHIWFIFQLSMVARF